MCPTKDTERSRQTERWGGGAGNDIMCLTLEKKTKLVIGQATSSNQDEDKKISCAELYK